MRRLPSEVTFAAAAQQGDKSELGRHRGIGRDNRRRRRLHHPHLSGVSDSPEHTSTPTVIDPGRTGGDVRKQHDVHNAPRRVRYQRQRHGRLRGNVRHGASKVPHILDDEISSRTRMVILRIWRDESQRNCGGEGRGVVAWHLKVFEKQKRREYRLHEESIRETSFPLDRIRSALVPEFRHVRAHDAQGFSRPKKTSRRLYWACQF